MARTKRGWLKADALKTAGVKEQRALKVDGVTRSVELWWDERRQQFVVTYMVRGVGTADSGEEYLFGARLPSARLKFDELCERLT